MSQYQDDVSYDDQVEVPVKAKTWLHNLLESSPWLGISLVIHLVIGLIAILFAGVPQIQETLNKLVAFAPPKKVEVERKVDQLIPPDARVVDSKLKDPSENPVSSEETPEDFTTPSESDDNSSEGDPTSINAITSELGAGSKGFGASLTGARLARKGSSGATRETEKAVYDALSWLKRHQSPDGHWDISGFMNNGDASKPLATGPGNTTSGNIGVTSLALLAFLGGGYDTERNTEFRHTVWLGLNWLSKNQMTKDSKRWEAKNVSTRGLFVDLDEDGNESWDAHSMYSHFLASLAMSEAYYCTKDRVWKRSAQMAIEFMESAQNPHPRNPSAKYGWRYHPKDGDCDLSVTGWALMALKSGKEAGLKVSNDSLLGVKFMIEDMTSSASGRTSYALVQGPGGQSSYPEEKDNPIPAITECCSAIAIFCRCFLPEKSDFDKPYNPKSPIQIQAADLLKEDLPTWDTRAQTVDYYYWYYGTLAMFQMGDRYWDVWNNRLMRVLLPEQNQDTDNMNFHGSWDPKPDKWGDRGGRVFATAINCLTLEVYYRYPRVFGGTKN